MILTIIKPPTISPPPRVALAPQLALQLGAMLRRLQKLLSELCHVLVLRL